MSRYSGDHRGHRLDVLPCPGGGSRAVCACGVWRGPQRLRRAQAWADGELWRAHIKDTGPVTGVARELANQGRSQAIARTANNPERIEKHRAAMRAYWERKRRERECQSAE